MSTKRYKAEQILTLLRQVEVVVANGRRLRRPVGSRHQRANLLPLAQGVWRPQAGPSETAQSAGTGER
jgi:hypothetical protein